MIIVQKLVAEQWKETLFHAAKCKAFLADYTKNEFRKERHLLLIALKAGAGREIANAGDLEIAKKQQIRLLNEERFIDKAMAVEVVDFLAYILRGDRAAQAAVNASSASASNLPPGSTASRQAPRQSANRPSTRQPAKARQGKNGLGLVFLVFFAACIIIFAIGRSATQTQKTATPTPQAATQTSQTARQAESAGEIFARAKAAYDNKNYQEAVTLYNQGIALDPNDAMAYNNRGVAYARLGNHYSAIEDYNQAIKLNPNFAMTYSNRGVAYARLNDLINATKDARKACDLGNCEFLQFLTKNNLQQTFTIEWAK